jgi:Holliday junction DNA helicase RuvA
VYYSFHGNLVLKEPTFAVIECNGVGYRLGISLNTFNKLSDVGDDCLLFSYLSVKEDALELYGFYEESELNAFKQLISVSGVGCKVAMSILSELTPDRFALAVISGDNKAFTRVSGVGPKLAGRLILELKDKIQKENLSVAPEIAGVASVSMAGNLSEAAEALCALGYTRSDAVNAVSKTGFTNEDSVDLIIRKALKLLSK